MFILLTDYNAIAGEHLLVEKMLTPHPHVRLHVRKSFIDADDQQEWLMRFDASLRQRMVVHQYHDCAIPCRVGGIHFKEGYRMSLSPDALHDEVNHYKASGLTVSTPFHDRSRAEGQDLFDYVTLSPVFDSVSKSGYEGQRYQLGGHTHPIIGLGGMTPDHLGEAYRLGYDGIAVLGYVWQSSDPLARLDEMVVSYDHYFTRDER